MASPGDARARGAQQVRAVALGPRAGHELFPGFDGLRAMAALGVVLTHVSYLSGRSRDPSWGPYLARADAGVAVFFLISGFLLGRPFLAAVVHGRPLPGLRGYARRRLLRIYPAYWAAFAFCGLALGLTSASWGATASQLLLVHTYRTATSLGPGIVQKGGTIGRPLGPSWTLAVEVTFYAFLPLFAKLLEGVVVRVGADPRRRRRFVGGVLAGLGAASLIARIVVYSRLDAVHAGLAGDWLPLNLDWFSLGMGLALLADAEAAGDLGARARRVVSAPLFPWASWALAALCFVAVSRWAGLNGTQLTFTTSESVSRQVLYGGIGLFLLLPAALGPPRAGTVRRALAGVPLRQLGLVSYGIYLWQDIVIDQYLRHTSYHYFATPFWSALGLVVVGAVAAGAASFLLVERPAQRARPWVRSAAR